MMVMQMENCAIHRRRLTRRLFVIKWLPFVISASILLFIAHTAQANNAGLEPAQLQLKPNRCVALHQGQVCYQKIQLSWRVPQVSNYCLYQQHTETPLYCWRNVAAGEYQYEFASDTSTQLQLVNIQTKTTVATAALEVAWVYKANTRRKTHWRIF